MAKKKAKLHRPDIEEIVWTDIPGYEGRYQVTVGGHVRRIYPSGATRLMTPYPKKSTRNNTRRNPDKTLYVKLTKDGVPKEVRVMKIVADTFLKQPPGTVPYHKNGDVTDNFVNNIGFATQKELGGMTGAKSRRINVVKLTPDGEIVEIYPSAREAAKQNAMSYQTVLDRCNNKVKKPFALDGHNYQFDLEEY